jgi:hypothetical protein
MFCFRVRTKFLEKGQVWSECLACVRKMKNLDLVQKVFPRVSCQFALVDNEAIH